MTTSPDISPPEHTPAPRTKGAGGLRLLSVFLVILLVTIVLVVAGVLLLRSELDRRGIDRLAFQVESLSVEGLSLGWLQIGRGGSSEHRGFQWQGQDIRVGWRWDEGWLPRLSVVELKAMRFSAESHAGEGDPLLADAVLDPVAWQVPGWFPERVHIRQAEVMLPCEEAYCEFRGTAAMAASEEGGHRLELELNREPHQVQVQLDLRRSGEDAELDGEVWADGQPLGQLQARWRSLPGDLVQWSGQVEIQGIPQQGWLQSWLPEGARLNEVAIPQGLDGSRLSARWDARIPQQLGPEGLQPALTGALQLQARLPEYMSLPLAGPVRGELDLDLKVRQGHIEDYWLEGDLHLSALPGLEFLTRFEGLDPGALQVRVQGEGRWEGVDQTVALLNVQLESQGELQGVAKGLVAIPVQWPLSLELRKSTLNLQSNRVSFTPETVLHEATAYLDIQGRWQPGEYHYLFSPDSWIRAETVELPVLDLQKAQLQAKVFKITPGTEGPRSEGNLQLVADNLSHPQLQPQSWRTEGSLAYDVGHLKIDASARSASGLGFSYELARVPNQPMRLDWSAGDIFLLAQNPLPGIFRSWPELAELSRGRLSAWGWVLFPGDSNPETELEVTLRLQDVGGLYDRIPFSGLSAELIVHRLDDYLTVSSEELRVDQLNPGIEIGPLHLQGSYAAPLADLNRGMVNLRQLELRLLGGRVWAEPVHFSLSEREVQVPLLIRGLDLSKVLSLYPAEDLEGHGTVDGILPLTISGWGISVAEGNLLARPPGGVLRYRPEKVREMAQTDARMELLATVLENFHYSHLSSDINYVESGELTLGVQLRGRNPQMSESPPVNLNISLEENLPMLLASLQMAGDLSDTVKKRVSEALERRARTQSQ